MVAMVRLCCFHRCLSSAGARKESRSGQASEPDAARLIEILDSTGAQGCYQFSLDPISPAAIAYARFFNPTVGIVEDSATGSAAGPLSCQLVARGVARENTTITIEQGSEMGRPSLLSIHVRGGSVQLSGRCVTVARGTLLVTLDPNQSQATAS
jgi:trans-2,3-dihydro-3-hydroxyanthranilate isomerase